MLYLWTCPIGRINGEVSLKFLWSAIMNGYGVCSRHQAEELPIRDEFFKRTGSWHQPLWIHNSHQGHKVEGGVGIACRLILEIGMFRWAEYGRAVHLKWKGSYEFQVVDQIANSLCRQPNDVA